MKNIFLILLLLIASKASDLKYLPIGGVNVEFNDDIVTIQREIPSSCFSIPIDEEHLWGESYAHKRVPSECKKSFVTTKGIIQPMKLVDGVETVGELEVLDFLDKKVSSEPNEYLLIDSRTNGWYEQNTIPGAVNVPYTDLEYDEDFIEDYNQALRYLGIKIKKDGTYDFTDVKEVIMFCNGSWCAQSPNAIKHLVKIGFPPKKIKWYRGGMTSWLSVGLSTMPGKEE